MSSEVEPIPDASEPPRPEPTSKAVHKAVLLDEVIHWLNPREGAILVDGTAGAGGHTRALAERVGQTGRVVGLDRDPNMLALAAINTRDQPHVSLVQSPYSEVEDALETLGLGRIDGVLLDLGLSSDQLAWHDRGFSFSNDGPLDMRFDPDSDIPSAADLVNTLKEQELADIFYRYGEERHSRRVAWRIVEARKLSPIMADLMRKS